MAEQVSPDHALREAYRALMRKASGEPHLDESAWERLATGTASQPERDRLFDHVVGCEPCGHIWRALLELQREATAQGLITPEPRRHPWQSTAAALALAATLVLIVGGVLLTRRPTPVPDTVRSGGQLPSIDGLMMAYNPDYVPTFVWPPVPSATQYRVEVFGEDGRPVWTRTAPAPPLPWPTGLPTAKGAYRWRVEALKGDAVVARSRFTPMELIR